MPDPVPSPAELQSVILGLETSCDELLARCAGLDPSGWARSDGDGRWSVAGIVEHLVLIERGMVKMELKMQTEPPEENWAESTAGKEAMLRQLEDAPQKMEAPERVRPAGAIAPADLVEEFRSARNALIAIAAAPGQPLKAHTRPHLRLGPLNGCQWLLFVTHHTRRHLRQIERCLGLATGA